MRSVLAAALVLASFVPPFVAPAAAGMRGLTGNDTGGVIQWTPETDLIYRDIAAAHCARWNRIAKITSAHRWYGEFIGFVCLYDREYDPRKAWLYSYQ
jgi:hypothetical protein